MNLKTKVTLMLIMIFNISLFAQDGYELSGTISDKANMPLPGVNVIIANSSKGTSTDFDGKFKITVRSGDVLDFSFIGYIKQSITITNQKTLNVVMEEDTAVLDEVVVVGYGTRKKSHLTGAIAKIGGEDVAAVQVARVDEALAGKLPGVLIQNQSGEPGSDLKVQIRTGSSLSSSSDPLIVVDGFPISGNLATVNPNDIESMEVLKDAASAAIYGSLGANGVILVTTKKGKSGKLNFSYNAYTSTSRKYVKDIEMLKTAGEWAEELQSGAYDLSQTDPGLLEYRLWAYENAPDVVSMEDWLFQSGNSTNHDFSVSGGSENMKAFASIGYLNTDGIVKGQGYERYNGRMNIDANLNDKLKAGISMNGFYGHQDIVPWEMRDLLRAYSISPIYHTQASIDFVQELDARRQALFNSGYTGQNIGRTFDQDYRGIGLDPTSIYDLQPGDVVHDWQYGRNQNGIGGTGDAGVAAKFDNSQRYKQTLYGNVSSYLEYEILEGLNIKTIFGADSRDVKEYYYRGVLTDGQQRSNQTDLDISNIKKSTVLSTTTLDYSKVIADKHDISAVIGMEFVNTKYRGISSNGTNVPVGLPLNYSFFESEDVVSQNIEENQSRRGFFGRIAYAFDDRYLVSASIRRDGDSRFGANEKYAVFPAFSLGWNMHNESFLENNAVISLLKPRFSMGSLGTSSDLGSYSSLSILGTSPTAFGTGFLIPDEIANADLTWQTNKETNYGVDTGFLNNRFRFSVDYYTSDVNDMLINQSVSEVLGTPQIRLNRGDITSSGLEFELNANLLQKDNFSWSINANLSTVESEITSLGDLDELPRQIYGGPSGRGAEFRNYVGGELGEMWGYESAGQVESIYMEDPTRNIGYQSGLHYVVDQNGDGEITYEDDYVKLGSATPDFYWGVSSNFNYKNFDFAFQFQGSQGAEVYNIDPIYWQSLFRDATGPSFDANNDGIADNNGLHYLESRDVHGGMIQDASYIALRNLTLGYTLDSDFISKVGIGSMRVYLAASNLLYIMGKDYTSFNPEGIEIENDGYAGPTTYGYQEGASPIVRSFTFGVNVNF
ncbi:SusC/RagA family TonB-linked outer membrane protein [Pseudalgibacter alginicilyticus]|uniref:SusC/RagA family TonB-linked outer membrane protein n=1 Tax=Pseudalgibacter alginicilyticus TaxID=1736674 RepID=A0A0P0CJI7_9FLAO|nr:TonB-dependent receptor [Pseudalgibacter alginicilyticus]ALJ06384.1 SusC/RagA family TonB-linked outer membrane protein [Pseudalgibacter alginicilyticus]